MGENVMVLCGGAVGGKWHMCEERIIARCIKERCGEWGSGSCTRWCAGGASAAWLGLSFRMRRGF